MTPYPPSVPSGSDLTIEQVRENLYLLRGGGRTISVGGGTLPTAGTSAALVTDRGVLLVDTKMPGWGGPIQATSSSTRMGSPEE
jgi:hypothetical protein